MGYRAPYVPGYDNHGLPIEQSVMKAFHEKKQTPTQDELRKACRDHAEKFISVQTEQFQRLGVFGLWEKPYKTMDFRFEAEIVRTFKKMVEHGFVYRGLRPTLWSPTQRTALADSEIVYKDHVSKAIYVRFPLKHDLNGFSKGLPNFYTIIWTTTPWTIPANLAVAFHPTMLYSVVKVGDDHYLILDELVKKVAETLGWSDYAIVLQELGISFEKSRFKHPLFDRDSLAVCADYVTTEDGTGVVHTAPGHGRDDFFTGLKYGLPTLCPVDERGVLTSEAGEFAGVNYKDCDKVVVDRLAAVGNLLHVSDYSHSYPHSERDGKPVIFRATEQWFVSMDHNHLRSRMLEQIELTQWYPKSGKARIQAMITGSPDWCISRQRPWGVGIPIFYGKNSRKPVLDSVAIEAVAQMVEANGSDGWFVLEPGQILPNGYVHPDTGETEFVKETDVLDVWFDSGSTSFCVYLAGIEPEWEENWPLDIYFEGSDQHRGWFNRSLVLSTAIKGCAPFKQVGTHGFVNDEKGLKMSKSLGNVVEPIEAADQYGADVLRYWVASVNFENDVPCSDALLKQFGESYRSVRNTLRFLLSNLYDYEPSAIPKLLDLDEWVIEQADLLTADCKDAYSRYDFGSVISSVHNFCVNELSRFYLDAIKDRMYCDGKFWETRRSAQEACRYVLLGLVKLVAPVLCFTAEETYERIPGGTRLESVHMEQFNMPSPERLLEIEGSDLQVRFAGLLAARAKAFAAFEEWKVQAGVKDSQDATMSFVDSQDVIDLLSSFGCDIHNYFKMSWVELQVGEPKVGFAVSQYLKCERSRLRRPDVEIVNEMPLTLRDRKALGLAA